MSKDLFLIRHAHAESNHKLGDFNRKLSYRGLHEAENMSEQLLQHAVIPELALSSPATRAMSTCKIFAETLSIPFNKIQLENMIYEASAHTLLSIINHIDNRYQRVALFGHNPGLSELTDYLSDAYLGNIPPAGIVQLNFDVPQWDHITGGIGRIIWYSFPEFKL